MSEADNAGRTGGALDQMIRKRRVKGTPQLPVHRAFRQSLAVIADEMFATNFEIHSVEDIRLDADTAVTCGDQFSIHYTVSGPNGGPGLVILNPAFVAALVEIQTVGCVSGSGSAQRVPTATDAAIAEGYVDHVLGRLSTMMNSVSEEEWACGHKIKTAIFDLHKLPLELPDIPYRSLRAVVGFGPDGAEGEMAVILPDRPVTAKSIELGRRTAEAMNTWQGDIKSAALASRVVLNAVLDRREMSLGQLTALKSGDRLPLPEKAETQIRLEGIDGTKVAIGRIGMVEGAKAIRLTRICGANRGAHGNEDRPMDLPASETATGSMDLSDLGIVTPAITDQSEDEITGDGVEDWTIPAPPTSQSTDDLPELDIAG